jgi:hypothetical protein
VIEVLEPPCRHRRLLEVYTERMLHKDSILAINALAIG